VDRLKAIGNGQVPLCAAIKCDGCKDLTKQSTSTSDYVMPRSLANKILNRVREGETYHPLIVTKALITTGDWS
jgi:hypothetical protein